MKTKITDIVAILRAAVTEYNNACQFIRPGSDGIKRKIQFLMKLSALESRRGDPLQQFKEICRFFQDQSERSRLRNCIQKALIQIFELKICEKAIPQHLGDNAKICWRLEKLQQLLQDTLDDYLDTRYEYFCGMKL